MVALLSAAGFGAGACAATTYAPTQPRPQFGPGVMVEILSVHGAANQAELAIHSAQAAPPLQPTPPPQPAPPSQAATPPAPPPTPPWTSVGPVTWSPGDREPCSGATPLTVVRGQGTDTVVLDAQFPSQNDDVVTVLLGSGRDLAASGLFLDVAVATDAGPGCLRLPLTAAGAETLWQAARVPWMASFGLRLEDPLDDLGNNGASVNLDLRVIRPLGASGAWRPFFGFTIGGASCRGANCPPFEFSDDEDSETAGLWFHYGGEVGLERRLALGRRSLGLTGGARLLGTHLGAHDGYVGDRNGALGGPFAAVSFFGGTSSVVPGFAPPARRGALGVELSLARQTAFGRPPGETAWVAAFAVRFEGSN